MQAAGRRQKMQNIRYSVPSESKYNTVNMKGKQSIAVDVYDQKTTDILMTLLHVLCSEDGVSLSTFGNHIHRVQLEIGRNEWETMNRVNRELNRICTRSAPAPYKSAFMKPCAMFE